MNVHSYVGEIRMYGGLNPPEGFVLCDGRLLPISQYELLYVMIGTTFGGDGNVTFAVPDLRSRVPINIGQDGDTPNVYLGQPVGNETITVIGVNAPAHNHPVTASIADGKFQVPGNTFMATGVTPFIPPDPQTEVSVYAPAVAASTVAMSSKSVSYTGGAPTASLIQYYQTINYMIAYDGEIFRPQD